MQARPLVVPAGTGGGAPGQSALQVRAFGFGDLTGGPWGIAWVPPQTPATALLAPSGDEPAVASLELDGHEADERWRVRSAGVELTLEGLGEPGWTELPDQPPGFDQLCRVTGVLKSAQRRDDISTLGWRSARPEPLSPGRSESLRQVAGWFDPGEGFALLAVRPREAPGQDRDAIAASLLGPGGPKPVADPRLSTTYLASGQPARASVELWVDTEGDPDTQYPRRANGEALGPPAGWKAGELALEAQLFRWHSSGQEGAGLYLLGRPQ
jgi:hypothetical protein